MIIQHKNSFLPCIFDGEIVDFEVQYKKLYRQSKLLPVANQFNKSRYESSFNDWAFSFLLTYLVILLLGSFPFRLTFAIFQQS